jgi:predicted ATPase
MARTWFHNPEQGRLLGSAWSLCERQIKAFEQAWRTGSSPALTDFLQGEGGARLALLVELVHVDLEFRLKAGQSVRVEHYLGAYPELATDRTTTLDLILAEYLLRDDQGGANLSEYRLRFPDYLDDLKARIAAASATPSGPAAWPAVPGYEILQELGKGGMGVVYKARDLYLGRHVALKFLPPPDADDPDRLQRFLREARMASALNHPHICTVHALGEHEGRPFLVLEFIEGQTLQALAAHRPPLLEAVRVIAQAAQALAAAHAAGVVHRDVKPENIMFRGDGYVKVLDFGLARRLPTLANPTPVGERDTAPGTLLGTVPFMSPEQARGAPAECASDVFSLGIVLYQLTTGRHPFEAESALGTLHAIATQQPIPPGQFQPEISTALAGLIEAMLHKDARLRPTAAEVEQTLASLKSGVRSQESGQIAAARPVVHREPELAALRAALARADAGRGSIVCVAGEPGIGKTTLVEDFLGELASTGRTCLVARGQCSERLAGTEAYLPVIDALGDLLRGDASGTVARLMRVVAPTWYTQVAPLAGESTAAPAASQPAMLREFCTLLEEASRLDPVVLFFDDVHWADVPTVDLLAHLGRRCQGLRVLAVVAYRLTELLLGQHPFHRVKLELQARGACSELPLAFLDRPAIDRYLQLAFPGHDFPAAFAGLIHARTEGSPLFLADLLRDLQQRGAIVESGAATAGRWSLARQVPDLGQELPASVRAMIERKLERLGEDDRRLLATASVQGAEFDSAVSAHALGLDPAEAEERLQTLDRLHGLVRRLGEAEFPDGTLTVRYAFVHVLYQQALYGDLAPTRRAALASALARAIERHHGEGSAEAAAQLACLYEVGRDFARAAWQFYQAAQNAACVFAHGEAAALARRGLTLLGSLPQSPARTALELPLQTMLGLQLQVTRGFADPEAERAYRRARELCPWDARAFDPAPLVAVLWGLWLFHKVRSELATAQELAGEFLALARRLEDPALVLQAHQAHAVTALCRGEPVVTRRHMEQATALYDPGRHLTHALLFGQDPGIACTAIGAVALWLLGFPDEASRLSEAAVRRSERLSPATRALALHFAAMLHQLRRDVPRVRACVQASAAVATEHGLSFWLAGAEVLDGWALALGGAGDGVPRLRQGLRDWLATGSVTYHTYHLGLLAEALGERGQVEEAGRVLEEALALAQRTGEGLYEAELYRLRGEVLLRGTAGGEAARRAEDDFRRALEIARRQEARSLQLRAAMSLYRLQRRTGAAQEGREMVAEVRGGFTEGFDTPDLKEAGALLADGG